MRIQINSPTSSIHLVVTEHQDSETGAEGYLITVMDRSNKVHRYVEVFEGNSIDVEEPPTILIKGERKEIRYIIP